MINININDIGNKVRNTLLTGLNLTLTGAITAADTVLQALGKLQNQINGKEDAFAVLPINKGGTNSNAALNNNRIMQSSGGSIVEAPAIIPNRVLVSDSNGIPIASNIDVITFNASKPYLIDYTKTTSTGAVFNQTVVRSYLIPAGTFKTGDQIRISIRVSRPASQTNNSQYFVLWSYNNITYNSMTTFGAINATTRFARMYRHYDVVNEVNATESVGHAAHIFTDDTISTTPIAVNNINWTQNVYLGIALTQSVATDSSTIESVMIQIFRP
jgi:cyclophilin family peptidyl-prolyl cis-trans isomerase